MTRYRKIAMIEAHQWFKNGDHPHDRVGKRELDVVALTEAHPELFEDPEMVGPVPEDAPTYERLEGAVVRFFRSPDPEYAGDLTHAGCGHTWHDHGWVDETPDGHVVCPGDWIVTGPANDHWPIKPDVFAETYEAIE